MEEINTVFLSIGSNLGDRLGNLNTAVDLLKKNNCTILQASRVYETDAIGFETQNRFLNAALKIETNLSPVELLTILKRIENQLGRKEDSSNTGYQSRTIDIDIIFYNDLNIESDILSIPHPSYHERLFVLKPLKDLIDKDDVYLFYLVETNYTKVQLQQSIDETRFSLIH